MVLAKVGDLIQSRSFRNLEDGSIIGVVKEIKEDDFDGVTYVYFQATLEILQGGKAEKLHELMRVPQNGTRTSRGGVTDGIYVL